MALALVRYGLTVAEVFGTVTAENFVFVRRLAEMSPQTRVYSNMEPTMIHYDASGCPVDVALGKDAAWYHPAAAHLDWNSDVQPFGYAGVRTLFESLREACAADAGKGAESPAPADPADNLRPLDLAKPLPRGLRTYLTPFAPDQ
jgi:nitrogenase molybdenum-cofactor synthesis protein NifE